MATPATVPPTIAPMLLVVFLELKLDVVVVVGEAAMVVVVVVVLAVAATDEAEVPAIVEVEIE